MSSVGPKAAPGPTPAPAAPDSPVAATPSAGHTWATVLPTLCAIHCLVTPALIALFPFMHFLKSVEPVLFSVSLVLAGWAVGSGYRRHRDVRVWIPTVVGAVVWGTSIAGFLSPLPEGLTDVAGGLLLAAGVYWSGQLRHRSVCNTDCSCPAPH